MVCFHSDFKSHHIDNINYHSTLLEIVSFSSPLFQGLISIFGDIILNDLTLTNLEKKSHSCISKFLGQLDKYHEVLKVLSTSHSPLHHT